MREAMNPNDSPAPGRPREFDEGQALMAIMEIFWSKGYEGASMSDLVAATGVKKGSLYAAFGDKRAMYRQALAHYDRVWIEVALRDLGGGGPALARIENFLQSAANVSDPRGCFTCNASIDQAALDPESARLVRTSLDRLQTALTRAVSELPHLAELDQNEITARARHLMSVYFGLRVMAKACAEADLLDQARQAALRSLMV